MLLGKPRAVVMDLTHYRKIKRLAKRNRLKFYEVLHEIIDRHCERMTRLEELKETEKGREAEGNVRM